MHAKYWQLIEHNFGRFDTRMQIHAGKMVLVLHATAGWCSKSEIRSQAWVCHRISAWDIGNGSKLVYLVGGYARWRMWGKRAINLLALQQDSRAHLFPHHTADRRRFFEPQNSGQEWDCDFPSSLWKLLLWFQPIERCQRFCLLTVYLNHRLVLPIWHVIAVGWECQIPTWTTRFSFWVKQLWWCMIYSQLGPRHTMSTTCL